uniref:Ig-like domain-containing protein n=1 Tax=Taeniopygia guttata TaxID=59729 RepID=A0A674HT48_TAEGU
PQPLSSLAWLFLPPRGRRSPTDLPGPAELLKWELDTLRVQCPAGYGMVWCRGGQTGCTALLSRTASRERNSTAWGGVRIQDDTQQGIVTVTMEQLQVQDSGVYWCALQDGSGLLRMEEVTLSVSKGGYGSGRTRLQIPDSLPCSLLCCTAYPTSHLACSSPTVTIPLLMSVLAALPPGGFPDSESQSEEILVGDR